MSGSEVATAALQYARQGRPVLPCTTPTSNGCSCHRDDCSSAGKHPRTRNGLRDATTDVDAIEGWWRRWPEANIGVLTGRQSGLVVVDIDPGHGGVESMRRLVAEHGPLPPGPRVHTGSGGWHVLFAWPGHDIANSAGRVAAGVDIRGDGGYVIAPPSLHPSGGRYVWTRGGTAPEMPEWLARLVEPPRVERPVGHEPIRITDALDRWAAAALRGEIDRVRFAPEGSRNHTLNRAAFALGQIAGTGALDADTVESHLRHAAVSAGLGEREAALTIRSGLNAGIERPRGPTERPTPTPAVPSISSTVAHDIEPEIG